jgi:hypothetical protein
MADSLVRALASLNSSQLASQASSLSLPLDPSSGDTKRATLATVREYVATGTRIYVPLPFFGELTDEQVFGYFKANVAVNVIGTLVTAQDAPTGSSATFDIVNGANTEQSLISTLVAGDTEQETIFGSPLTLAAGEVCRAKVKSVGSTLPGGWVTLTLICTPQ